MVTAAWRPAASDWSPWSQKRVRVAEAALSVLDAELLTSEVEVDVAVAFDDESLELDDESLEFDATAATEEDPEAALFWVLALSWFFFM